MNVDTLFHPLLILTFIACVDHKYLILANFDTRRRGTHNGTV